MKIFCLLFFSLFLWTSCSSQEEGRKAFKEIEKKYEQHLGELETKTESTFVYTPLVEESQGQENSFENKQEAPELLVSLEYMQKNKNIELILHNPEGQLIQSVRLWLAFPPSALTIKNLNLNNTLFPLAAPDEYKVDKENGIIKIGLSAGKGTRSTKISLGSFDAINNMDYPAPLSCYDYGQHTDSHCTVLGEEGKNILQEVSVISID